MQKNLTKFLPQFVYGSIDGTVTTFAIVAGVSGASLPSTIVLILGIANVLADGFSMASSNYLSEKSKSSQDTLPALKTSLATFISFVVIGFVPISPYIFNTPNDLVFSISCILTGITFFVIGYVRGAIVGKNKFLAALETFIVGGSAATISYLVGYFLQGLA